MSNLGLSTHFAWCSRCERVYPTAWWIEQHWHCPNPTCDGESGDAWEWAPGCRLLQEHPEYPEMPETGERYPLSTAVATPASERTAHVIVRGKALVRAIEAMSMTTPAGWFEWAITRILLHAYRRRLWVLIVAVPPWAAEEVLGAGPRVGAYWQAVWMSDN